MTKMRFENPPREIDPLDIVIDTRPLPGGRPSPDCQLSQRASQILRARSKIGEASQELCCSQEKLVGSMGTVNNRNHKVKIATRETIRQIVRKQHALLELISKQQWALSELGVTDDAFEIKCGGKMVDVGKIAQCALRQWELQAQDLNWMGRYRVGLTKLKLIR